MEDIYFSAGNSGLVTVTNFTGPELDELWSKIEDQVLKKWNVGRGRKVMISLKMF